MRWPGTMLHLLYPPSHDAKVQALAAATDERRAHVASIAASRRRLEAMADDPLDGTLTSIIKDL